MATLNQFTPVSDFQRGQQNALSIQSQQQGIAREASAAPIRNQLSALGLEQQKAGAERSQIGFDQKQVLEKTTIINQTAKAIRALDPSQYKAAFSSIMPQLQKFGIDTSRFNVENITAESLDQVIAETQGFISDPNKLRQLSAAESDFRSKTQGLSQEDTERAKRIALGLDPRATGAAAKTVDVGGVPHVFDPVKQTLVPAIIEGQKVTSEIVGESKATIKEREKFAELTGASRAKSIDKGFDRIAGIDKNMLNLDRALGALERGAGTGAAEKFFPSITAASRELNQIQNELALDIIGAVTFGALSQGELDLAKDTALDRGLSEEALKDVLQRKKAAQQKLRGYLNEQIQFLDQGGTVAGFLREKERQNQQAQPEQQAATQQQADQGQIMEDAQGNRARVFQDGRIEEL